MMKRVVMFSIIFSACICTTSSIFAVSTQSLGGRYNIVMFGSDYGLKFTSGVGYIDFDGAGQLTGMITELSHGQSNGKACDTGPVSGAYSVSPSGWLKLTEYDNGYVSSDGSLFIWVPVPGDIPCEEAGINVGIKQGSGMGVETLNGVYNIVGFKGIHAAVFSSGIGHLNFDGAGRFTFDIEAVSHGQGSGEAMGVETGNGTYLVDPNGRFVLSPEENPYTGYVSADGSLAVWAATPGDKTLQETGITVAVKQGAGMDLSSVNGEYNMVWFWSSLGSGFHSAIAHLDFDGAGNWTGEVDEISFERNPGSDSPAGLFGGKYYVSPTGKLTLDDIDNGYVSADGSLLVWAPVPGDVSDREVGINIAVKKPAVAMDLTGEYWFGNLSADVDSSEPWVKNGTITINNNNWHQKWDDCEGHQSFAGTFTSDFQPDDSININHAWGSYNAAWNGNLILHADIAPDAKNRIGFDIITRKATDIDVNDIVGRYAYFHHYLGWHERYASVEWGTMELLSDSTYVYNGVNELGELQYETGSWTLDHASSIVVLSSSPDEQAELKVCDGGILVRFIPIPATPENEGGEIGYDFLVKGSSRDITPDGIAGEYVVRFLETSVYGQPFTCGKGNATIGADGKLNMNAYYSNGEHDEFDANYIVGPANKIQITSGTTVHDAVVSPDAGIIFLPEFKIPANPTHNDWIGGIFLVRSACNISDI